MRRWVGPMLALGFVVLARSVPAAPDELPAWHPLVGRGGQVAVEPLARDASGHDLPAYAARFTISPGAIRSGFASEGPWLHEALAGAGDSLLIEVRLARPDRVALAIRPPGETEALAVSVASRGGAPHLLVLPLGAGADRRLLVTTDEACTLEVLGVRATRGVRPTWDPVDPAEWPPRLEADQSLQARREWLARVARDIEGLERLGADVADARETARSATARLDPARAGRTGISAGDLAAVDGLLLRLDGLVSEQRARFGGLTPVLADGRLRTRAGGEPFVLLPWVGDTRDRVSTAPWLRRDEPVALGPYPGGSVRFSGAQWGEWLEARYGTTGCLLDAWGSDAALHGLGARESLESGNLEAPRPPWERDVRLADLLDWAWEAEQARARALVREVRAREPEMPILMAPSDPFPALPGLREVLFAAAGPVGTPAVVGLPASPLARRLSQSAPGGGLRTSGIALLDQGRVLLGPDGLDSETASALRACAADRPRRVALICSAREVVLGRSRALEMTETLRRLNVDADLLVDLELAHSGALPRTYRALIYEAASLDERAFRVAWRSGVPLFLVGPPGNDRRGRAEAGAVLRSENAFLRRATGAWRPGEVERVIPCGTGPAQLLPDPLEQALGAGWLKPDAGPPPAQESPLALGLAGRPCLRWHVYAFTTPEADAATGGRLALPAAIPTGCQAALNGEPLGQALAGPSDGASPLGALTLAIRPGLLRSDMPNRLALGLREGQALSAEVAGAIRFVPEPTVSLRVAEALGPLGANEEHACWAPIGAAALPPDALAQDARAIGVDKASGRALLVRQGNSLLWAGALPTSSPVLDRILAGFLANLGEAHVYPPNAQTARSELADVAGNVLVYRKDGDPLEIAVGGRSLLVPAAGRRPAFQRMGGATVVGLGAAAPEGSFQLFRRTELEVVPDSGEVTVTAVARNEAMPVFVSYALRTSGPACRLVLHWPVPGAPCCLATVDGATVTVQRRGSGWELRVPEGSHSVTLEARPMAEARAEGPAL